MKAKLTVTSCDRQIEGRSDASFVSSGDLDIVSAAAFESLQVMVTGRRSDNGGLLVGLFVLREI